MSFFYFYQHLKFPIMDKQIDKLIDHIRDLENRLGEVDNI